MSDALITALRNALSELDLPMPGDPELAQTPERVARLWAHWLVPPEKPDIRPIEAPGSGPVIIRDLAFHSMCAHHLVPFFGTVHVAFVPAGRIVGFGCVGRLLDWAARRPQLQERMVNQLADELQIVLGANRLIVVAQARQMCVELNDPGRTPSTIAIAGRGEWAGASSWEAGQWLLSGASSGGALP
jgi:GTP cyclohydrolase I